MRLSASIRLLLAASFISLGASTLPAVQETKGIAAPTTEPGSIASLRSTRYDQARQLVGAGTVSIMSADQLIQQNGRDMSDDEIYQVRRERLVMVYSDQNGVSVFGNRHARTAMSYAVRNGMASYRDLCDCDSMDDLLAFIRGSIELTIYPVVFVGRIAAWLVAEFERLAHNIGHVLRDFVIAVCRGVDAAIDLALCFAEQVGTIIYALVDWTIKTAYCAGRFLLETAASILRWAGCILETSFRVVDGIFGVGFAIVENVIGIVRDIFSCEDHRCGCRGC